MTSYADPSRARYPPESLPECTVTASVGTGATNIAKYFNFSPYMVELQRFASEAGTALETSLSSDGFSRRIRYHNEADADEQILPDPNKIIAKESLSIEQLTTSGGAEANISSRWNLTVRKPTIIDKIRLGIVLSEEEESLAATYDLRNQIKAGLIPRNTDLLSDKVYEFFDEIIEVGERLPTVAAGATYTIGGEHKVPLGKVCVLLGVSVNATTIAGVVGTNDTYLAIDRDEMQNYAQLDMSALPSAAAANAPYYMRMFVPAVDKFSVNVVTTTGFTAANAFRARFIYGIRDMTDLDHLRWNIGWRSTSEATEAAARIESLDLENIAKLGIKLSATE